MKQKIFEETKSQEYLELDFQRVGYPKPGIKALGKLKASFASCLRIVDPISFDTIFQQEFENGETLFSSYVSQTVGHPGQVYLFLGIGQNATL